MSTISAHIIHGLCVSLPFFLQHAVYYKTAYLCKQNHIIWVDRLEFAYKMDFSSDSSQSNRVVGIGIYKLHFSQVLQFIRMPISFMRSFYCVWIWSNVSRFCWKKQSLSTKSWFDNNKREMHILGDFFTFRLNR